MRGACRQVPCGVMRPRPPELEAADTCFYRHTTRRSRSARLFCAVGSERHGEACDRLASREGGRGCVTPHPSAPARTCPHPSAPAAPARTRRHLPAPVCYSAADVSARFVEAVHHRRRRYRAISTPFASISRGTPRPTRHCCSRRRSSRSTGSSWTRPGATPGPLGCPRRREAAAVHGSAGRQLRLRDPADHRRPRLHRSGCAPQLRPRRVDREGA